jgi:CDP-diglyceride synthetase
VAGSRARKILIRTAVGGGLALVLALALAWVGYTRSGDLVFYAGWLLSALAAWELHAMKALAGRRLGLALVPALLVTGGLVLAYTQMSWCAVGFRCGGLDPFRLAEALALLALLLTCLRMGAGKGVPFGGPGGLLMAAVLGAWALLPLPWLGHVWWSFGLEGLVALLVLSKIGDIAGYYVGNAIGRSHPFPRISPGKTTAGCVGSLVTGVVAGGACVAFGLLPEGRLGVLGGCLAGLVVNLAAQAGDLFESWVKRRAGVKDSGTWFGPSGGVLDLVDSLLFTVPVALLAWPVLFPGGWFPDGQPPILPPGSG